MANQGLDKDMEELSLRTKQFSCEEDPADETLNHLEAECTAKKVLAGKVISQHLMNNQAIREVVSISSKAVDGLEGKELGNNSFLFTFSLSL